MLPVQTAPAGRPSYTNLQLLPGILRLLRSGCRWRDLDLPGYPSGVTHWRRLRFWRSKPEALNIWKKLLKLLEQNGRLDPSLLALDGMLVPSHEFREQQASRSNTARWGSRSQRSLMPLVSRSQCIWPRVGWHDSMHARPTIDDLMMRFELPSGDRTINADRGYDGFALRAFFDRQGMMPNIRARRRTRSRPGFEQLYDYDKDLGRERYVVERTNGWFQSFRRLHFRYDRSAYTFHCLFWLPVLVVCVRRLPL